MYAAKTTKRVTKKVSRNYRERFVVNARGRKTAVLLSLKQYEKLLEDLHDLAVVAERRTEKPIAFEEMKRRLKKNGVV
jgi:PHD/YefM family antitoxin component YafN of YafNO toxin-antitoxin module